MHLSEGIAGNWSYGSRVSFSCTAGYNLTSDLPMMCLGDGSWNGTQPMCEMVTCPSPSMTANGSYAPAITTFHYRDVIQFSCQLGFDIIGPNNSYCNATGQWSDESPECQIKCCGNLTDLPHGSVVHTGGTTFGQTAHYNCNEGYTLNGTNTRICNASGHWTLEAPTCDVIRKFSLIMYMEHLFTFVRLFSF